MGKNHLFLVLLLVVGVVPGKTQEIHYQRPPAVIEEVALAKLPPVVRISEDNQWALQLEQSQYQSIEKLARPELKLAGLRICPQTFNASRQKEYTAARLMNIETQEVIDIQGIPEDAVITGASLSPTVVSVVLFVEERDGVYLYACSPERPTARKMGSRRINATNGVQMVWINDKEFVTLMVPDPIGEVPVRPAVPTGPVVQESTGEVMPARTYQDLLKDPYDERLFEYYFSSQLVRVKEGVITNLREPAIYGNTLSLSPDKSLLLISTIHRPYSYQVPVYNFAHTYEVIDLEGKTIYTLARNSAFNLPMGYDVASPYPRQFAWRADKPATVYWAEAQDKGDPKSNQTDFMDVVYQLAYPFTGDKQVVARTEKRFVNIAWRDDAFALLTDMSYATHKNRTFVIEPCSDEAPTLLFDVSMKDNYNNPGKPLMVKNEYDKYVVYTNKAHGELLMIAPGASPQGDRPYLSRYNLKTRENTELWRCPDGYYETIVKVTDPGKLRMLTSRQSDTVPANLCFRDLKKGKFKQLTHFANPYPAMAGVTKEKIKYKRADGLDLTATVYLPAGYDKEKDGPLPVLMWAYPREYQTKAEASQVRGSQYTFTTIDYRSPVFWVLRGYCVMESVEMPIVSLREDAEPNDDFVHQLTMNAEAAVKAISDLGVGDPDRVAVGGHSYGAFMTANLLTHTKLFKAGIARSGAYNRTLTPFGFQWETRTYWEAPEVYNAMSPFMYADQLHGALLLIHGEMDNNAGTFPIQSERLFNALKGHGAIARYVVLPYEGHSYRAKESILQLLYETDRWLEKYVKNANTTAPL